MSQSPQNQSNEKNDTPQPDDWPFDSDTLRELALLARDEKLGEIEIEIGAKRVSLRAHPDRETPLFASPNYGAAPPGYAPQITTAPSEVAPANSGAAPTATAPNANLTEVVSPMVGVFYRAPSPSDPQFVAVGDTVEVGQTLGLVETMKVFNEITSEVAGVVKEIRVETSQLVETGDVLMTIEGAGN